MFRLYDGAGTSSIANLSPAERVSQSRARNSFD
jgi:hypothetical protein